MLDIDLNVSPSIGSGIFGESRSDDEFGVEPMRRDDQNLQLLIEAARYVEEYGHGDRELSLRCCRELDQLTGSTRGGKRLCEGDSASQLGCEVEGRGGGGMVGRVGTEELLSSRPVVRTKRGRARVLPNKYRDSVMEPLSRLDRSDPVPTKRRSR